jgi:hypothetical protein
MKQIASALVKAQKAFGPALKTATNPHFRSKYANLSACIEAVIDALNDNGIALLQQNHPCDNGVVVETVFLHESGESLHCGQLHVPASKHDAQGYGSALTYARRYSLMAACGIAPEDDDGNAASTKVDPRPDTSAVENDPRVQKFASRFMDALDADITEELKAELMYKIHDEITKLDDPHKNEIYQAAANVMSVQQRNAVKVYIQQFKDRSKKPERSVKL